MVVEPEDAFPLPRESGLLGDGGEGTGMERDAVRFLAAFRGALWQMFLGVSATISIHIHTVQL